MREIFKFNCSFECFERSAREKRSNFHWTRFFSSMFFLFLIAFAIIAECVCVTRWMLNDALKIGSANSSKAIFKQSIKYRRLSWSRDAEHCDEFAYRQREIEKTRADGQMHAKGDARNRNSRRTYRALFSLIYFSLNVSIWKLWSFFFFLRWQMQLCHVISRLSRGRQS